MSIEVDKRNGRSLGEALLVSVFTPTWNRAHLLPRVFESLMGQTVRNFEWIVFDDGSTDSTRDIVESWFSVADFPIRYLMSSNRGKAAAINQGVELASGPLFLVLDSDDAAASNAMQRFAEVWHELERGGRVENYMGMSSLKVGFNGKLVGDDYSRLVGKNLSYIDRKNLGVRGDKWEILRTDLARAVPYPLHCDERYMAPSYTWLVLARDYYTFFINEALGIVEYQGDGISAHNIKHRVGSPRSTYSYYRQFLSDRRFKFSARLSFAANVNRFALHGGGPVILCPATIIMLPVSLGAYALDKYRLRKMAQFSEEGAG